MIDRVLPPAQQPSKNRQAHDRDAETQRLTGAFLHNPVAWYRVW